MLGLESLSPADQPLATPSSLFFPILFFFSSLERNFPHRTKVLYPWFLSPWQKQVWSMYLSHGKINQLYLLHTWVERLKYIFLLFLFLILHLSVLWFHNITRNLRMCSTCAVSPCSCSALMLSCSLCGMSYCHLKLINKTYHFHSMTQNYLNMSLSK